ncbi:hypothetical protein ACJX0J_036252, partial [Zea mays]
MIINITLAVLNLTILHHLKKAEPNRPNITAVEDHYFLTAEGFIKEKAGVVPTEGRLEISENRETTGAIERDSEQRDRDNTLWWTASTQKRIPIKIWDLANRT